MRYRWLRFFSAEGAGGGGERGAESGEQGASEGESVGVRGSPCPSMEQGAEAGEDSEAEELARLRGELAAAVERARATEARALESHRRALLAENAGLVVPGLVVGDSVETLEASLGAARAAYEAVRAATLAELGAAGQVGPGNGVRGPALDVESLSPVQKIAHGLRAARE